MKNSLESPEPENNSNADPSDTLPPLMSNLEIEKKTEESPRRQQEGEHDPIKHANSILAFFHDAIEDLDDAASSDVGTTIPDKVASREDFEALIPEDPDDWTEEMWDYCYQQEQEDMRNFAEQQFALLRKGVCFIIWLGVGLREKGLGLGGCWVD
ncbi:unnamed protein product [Prunus armeniaca]